MNLLDAFEKSDKVRREGWAKHCYVHRNETEEEFTLGEILRTDWEPVIEPELKFKEVVMYDSVLDLSHPVGKYIVTRGVLKETFTEALKEDQAIGYTEVKVFLKEEQ